VKQLAAEAATLVVVAEEDDTTYRIIRRTGPRPKRETAPSTPRALADGSGELVVAREELGLPERPSRVTLGGPAAPISVAPTLPAIATTVPTLPPLRATGTVRDGTVLEFGNMTIRIRHHGGVVHLELSDGTRLSGSDAQACELAAVLLRAGARR
jgi:hypothetical protein